MVRDYEFMLDFFYIWNNFFNLPVRISIGVPVCTTDPIFYTKLLIYMINDIVII